MPTIDNWRALREALDAGPTDNEWTLEAVEDRSIKHLCPVDVDGMSILTVVWHDDKPFAAVYLEQDARYIAAAHPAAIRSLLDERDRLAAEVEALRGAISKACAGYPADSIAVPTCVQILREALDAAMKGKP